MKKITEALGQLATVEAWREEGPMVDIWTRGTKFGAAEAAKAIAAHGDLTWKATHLWLDQAVSAGSPTDTAVDFGSWERGCRIMFMLKIRSAIV